MSTTKTAPDYAAFDMADEARAIISSVNETEQGTELTLVDKGVVPLDDVDDLDELETKLGELGFTSATHVFEHDGLELYGLQKRRTPAA